MERQELGGGFYLRIVLDSGGQLSVPVQAAANWASALTDHHLQLGQRLQSSFGWGRVEELTERRELGGGVYVRLGLDSGSQLSVPVQTAAAWAFTLAETAVLSSENAPAISDAAGARG